MTESRRFRTVSFIMVTCLCSLSAAERIVRPGEPIDANQIVFYPERWADRAVDTKLVPWVGENVVFLTSPAELDAQILTRLVERLDSGWALYAEITGRRPRPFKRLDGKATITAVPQGGLTCGYGCGYVGATGIEVAGFYVNDYGLLKSRPTAMPHYYFYEMGRNYYTFGDRHSLFITGFAVFMRYVCMDVLRCDDSDAQTRKTIDAAEALYSKTKMGFLRAFTTMDGLGEKSPRLKDSEGKTISPSDQPVLYASAMLKLRRDRGRDSERWLARFFRQLARCPQVKPKDKAAAVRQCVAWMVAASCAAQKDLSYVFVDRWRLAVHDEIRDRLSDIDWKAPDLHAGDILNELWADREPADLPRR